ncbi:MAG: NAD(P)/FAD-dependent oxidoreductase [Betaproteobacteria bacterium]|nr:NAD(P)/FAD-dependent oxidoreductase [Betaproteobacteria bacterium]
MMCAAQAGRRGRRVLLIEHAEKTGERIRISGGGRCNFTNRAVGAENFLSQNPHFCRSALARYSAQDFVALVDRHGIAWEERELGQLFCRDSAQDIIDLLKAECDAAQVEWAQPCTVQSIERLEVQGATQSGDKSAPRSGNESARRSANESAQRSANESAQRFVITTARGRYSAQSLVIATGGLAVPKLGASPFGYRVAEQFGLAMVAPKPALVPLALAPEALDKLKPIAGVAFDIEARLGNARFREAALVTHRGLSGPAILQISSYWQMQDYVTAADQAAAQSKRQPVELDLLPGVDAAAWLATQRHGKTRLPNLLAERLPRRFAHAWCELHAWDRPLNEFSTGQLQLVARALNHWPLAPSGTLGYAKAEVTLGGVATDELSSKTMEARRVPGLYFIGEVVDVTGWLGGYNFQWAWSSGWVAGQAV